jgi:hypothetical protein
LQCCQLQAELSGQFRGKIRSLGKNQKKSGLFLVLNFFKATGLKKKKHLGLSAWEKNNTSLIYLELQRIRRGKQTFKTFLVLSVQNRPKFSRRFVWPLFFLFGPF